MKTQTEEQKAAACLRSKLWAQNNRDKVRERSKRRAAQPEVKAYQKKYRDARREERREYNRKWCAANPEKSRAFAAAYRERNRAKIRIDMRGRARKALGIPEATRPRPEHCELCNRIPKIWHLDHCHETGNFRGWLCNRCNLALGHLGDNIEGLQRALDYLRRVKLTQEDILA